MSVDKKQRELAMNYEGPVFVTGAASTSTNIPLDQLVTLVTPPASGVQTMVLPNVAEAIGRIYTIMSNGNDTGTIAVTGATSLTAIAAVSLTAAGDRVVFHSDGVFWNLIFSKQT